jgi:hypothetical protein
MAFFGLLEPGFGSGKAGLKFQLRRSGLGQTRVVSRLQVRDLRRSRRLL